MRKLVFLAVAALPHLTQADVTVEAYYRADILSNTRGGIDTGTAWLDDGILTVEADVGALWGDEASMFAKFLYNNSTTFSDVYSGDAQVVSNIDAPHGMRIFELSYEQRWSDRYSLRVGLYDLNSEFDANDTGGLFMNSSHGIGPDYAQSGLNGPSIFPISSLAARFNWQVNNDLLLRYAILDGVPGDPDDPAKNTIDLSSDDGFLNALEADYAIPGGGRIVVGTWLYSADFDLIEGTAPGGAPLRDDGNSGWYGFIDTPLPLGAGTVEVSGFVRYGIADDRFNIFGSYIGGGIVATGLIASRPEDQLGVAIARVSVGDPIRRVVEAGGGSIDDAETAIELTWSTQLTDWLRIQPNIQFVSNPGVDPALSDALVVGLQFELSASRSWQD